MLIIYRVFINLVLLFLPFIFFIRLLKKKESIESLKQKIGFKSKKRGVGKLIWFHGASVGEIKSIVPIIYKYENQKNIKKILVTSNTASSLKVFNNLKFKKTIHQFFPIDSSFITKKFLNYWSPSKIFFVDSEIWPNMLINIKKKNIPLILLNGRISKKSFERWYKFKSSSKKLFSSFDLCFSSNKETKNYLSKLNAKNIFYIGNLKFSESDIKKIELKEPLKKILNHKKTWCASSTHHNEELLCAEAHIKLKKTINNLLTIIIPRHVERCDKIKRDLEELGLVVHLHESKKRVDFKTDIYLVNAYGKTKLFFNNCKNVFLGGSLINHGGQNPLEAARHNCNILHGPNTYNFQEIYNFLKNKNISFKVNNSHDLFRKLKNLMSLKKYSNKTKNKINSLGITILKETFKKINTL
jgi:3-deoxy-D-manno-octulosonic-acid transferase